MEAIRAGLRSAPFDDGTDPLGDPDERAREMAAAGSRNVVVLTITHHQTAPSLREFWESVQRTTAPFVLLRRTLGEEGWSDLAHFVHERLRADIGEGPLAIPFTAHLGMGAELPDAPDVHNQQRRWP
jgi:hypothetical protein